MKTDIELAVKKLFEFLPFNHYIRRMISIEEKRSLTPSQRLEESEKNFWII